LSHYFVTSGELDAGEKGGVGATVGLVPFISVVNEQEVFNLLGRDDEFGGSHADVLHGKGRATLLICEKK
jgi:hypothetical protein